MLNKKKVIFIGLLGMASMLYAYEPSVYGAGDISSANPYGLTETEKAVIENKKTLQMLYNRMNEQQRKIDGLTTIIEGQNREILELKEGLEAQQKVASSAVDQNTTYTLLLELGQKIDNISNNYVSRDELQNTLTLSAGEAQNENLGTPVVVENTTNTADSYRKGVQLFSTRSYNAARDYFEQTVAANYKPAASNYYLGEIAYYTHNYKDAVTYYKLSASLYDQASYMDVLFLHTAIALDKTGEKEQARNFYEHVINTYPNKKSASIAKNRL